MCLLAAFIKAGWARLCIRVCMLRITLDYLPYMEIEMKRTVTVIGAALIGTVLIAAACGSKTGSNANVATGKVIKTATVGNLTATLSNSTGQLQQGDQKVMLAFTDSSGKPVEVGAVSLNFHMAQMGPMAEMNDATTLTTTGTPGVYRGNVNIEVAGEWQGQLAYEGPAGNGKTTFTVTAR